MSAEGGEEITLATDGAKRRFLRLAAVLALLLVLPMPGGCRRETHEVRFAGGPTGGTFHRIAAGLADVVAAGEEGFSCSLSRSGGSLANLTGIEGGDYDMALVYAGDAYLAVQGRLPGQARATRLRALTRLYGAAAQLAVAANGPVRSPFDLRGKRVAIGSPGSGAALSAERFFRAIGLWDAIVPVHVGYTMAMDDLNRGVVQAVWEMVGVPSPSLSEASRRMPIRLLDLAGAARASRLFERYPFYRKTTIAADTYRGQSQAVPTFQDAALWVARSEVDPELVYRSLNRLFAAEGRARMRRAHAVGADIDPDRGLEGVEIPLHPGAERFWRRRAGESATGKGG